MKMTGTGLDGPGHRDVGSLRRYVNSKGGWYYLRVDRIARGPECRGDRRREGSDKIAYGYSDLSARLDVHLQLEHPTFKAAVRRIAEACNAPGKPARGSAETEARIEEYWQLGCKVLNLPGTDVSTYLDGLKARASRAHTRLKSIGVPFA